MSKSWCDSLVVVVLLLAAAGLATGQGAPSSYYGAAVTEDGNELPDGTTIIAVVDGTVEDQIPVRDGTYGGSGPLDEKLRVSDTSGPINFYVETADGSWIEANRTDEDPTSGTRRFALAFPNGTASGGSSFEVRNLQPGDTSVLDNETVTVTATVANPVQQGTETVSLLIDGTARDSRSVTLGTDESRDLSFTIDASTLGTGDHTYGVSTDDDAQTSTLTVESARSQVVVDSLDPAEKAVDDGTTFSLSAVVTNEGTMSETDTATLTIDGDTVAQQSVSLDAGETRTLTFSGIDSSRFGPGAYTYRVAVENDDRAGRLNVESTSALVVVDSLTRTDVTVTEGDEFDVGATIGNDGSASGTATVSLSVGGESMRTTSVSLDPGQSETVSFADIGSTQFGPGEYAYEISTGSDSRTGSLTVEGDGSGPPTFTVLDLDPESATAVRGDRVELSGLVENTGSRDGTQRLRLRIDGDRYFGRSLSVAAGNRTNAAFTVDTTSLEPGEYTYAFVTENDSQRGTLTVEQPATPTATTTTTTPTASPTDTATASPTDTTTASPTDTATATATTTTPTASPTDTATETVGETTERTERPTATTVNTSTDTTASALTTTRSTTVATTTNETTSGGGLLPMDLLGTVAVTLGGLVVVVYTILKALAIYLGY